MNKESGLLYPPPERPFLKPVPPDVKRPPIKFDNDYERKDSEKTKSFLVLSICFNIALLIALFSVVLK